MTGRSTKAMSTVTTPSLPPKINAIITTKMSKPMRTKRNGIEEAFNDLVMEILYEDGLASPLRAIMLKKQKVEKKKKCI